MMSCPTGRWLVTFLCLAVPLAFYSAHTEPPASLTALCSVRAEPPPASGVYFNDGDPDLIRLGSPAYEIGIRKTNGSIAYILDQASGQKVSEGSRWECLWGTVFADVPQPDDYVGGCHYHRDDSARRFSYEWDGAAQRLDLHYVADPAHAIPLRVWVEVTPSAGNWFDARLRVQNDSGHTVERVLFLSDLVVLRGDIQDALFPTMPGILLEPGFFASKHEYTRTYPSWPGVFADYLAFRSDKGDLAMYGVYKQDDPVATRIGFVRDDGSESYIPDSVYLYHTFYPALASGATWDSPAVRVHVGHDYATTLDAYRQANAIASFPSLRDKAGAQYDALARSPLFKIDVDRPMDEYERLVCAIPPALLHWVSFWPPSFDENYPDFLPPRLDWGSTDEMASLFATARACGSLNMPYTNPTWWDDESPTLEGLSDFSEIAIIGPDGTPRYECYPGTPDQPPCTPQNASRTSDYNRVRPPYQWLHGGYAVSPYAPLVRQRLAQLMADVTTQLPSDLVFEDQVGAGDRGPDYNVHAPSATSYLQGWIEHTRAYSEHLLMTETGYDLLAETEVGFHGSYLLLHRRGETAEWWGDGNWRPYPLVTMVARDKVLFYQHNLAPETFTMDKETFSWNLAMGYMLSYGLNPSEYGGGPDSPWLEWVGVVQAHVLAAYADERVTGFRTLAPEVTETRFETFTVTANWNEAATYDTGRHILAPQGAYVTDDEATVAAGILTAYNGLPLTAGDHFVAVERQGLKITVWQPIGPDTDLRLDALPAWSDQDGVWVTAYDGAGVPLGRSLAAVVDRAVTLAYRSRVDDHPVAYYEIAGPVALSSVHVPLVLGAGDDTRTREDVLWGQ
jgi:hypothetical protein